MKVMHNPEITARIKVGEYLEKEGKELVNFAYGTTNKNEKRFYVGIAYMPRNENDSNGYPPNRYDVVTYDSETDAFEHSSNYLNYENALIRMGHLIRKFTYENK